MRARAERPIHHRAGWLVVTLIVGAFYFWQIGAAFDRFVWSDHLDGYYDLLASGFVKGHLYLPVDPRPELLALPNPWHSPENRPYRMLDAALYQKRYYLYHGVAPAVFVFLPWRLLTGHDLPQDIAVFLFCLGGYFFLCELLIAALRTRAAPIPLWLFVLFCAALGLATCVPFLLQLTLVYEVAIASGFFCLSAAFFFFFRALTAPPERGARAAALCGLFFGLAVGCRPHLGLAIVPAFALILFRDGMPRSFGSILRRKELCAFTIPIVVCGLGLAAYNYARFGDPREFGLRYQLGEQVYQNFALSIVNVVPGLYYLIGCPPDLDSVFPFIRLAIRPPFNSVHFALPDRYFLEPTTGALFLCPLVLLALAAPFLLGSFRDRKPVSALVLEMYIFSVSCIVFIAFTGLNSQRFSVDFLPWLVLVACLLTAELLSHLRGTARVFASAAVAALLFCSITVNVLLALQGPFDQWLRNRPASFTQVANWFSPLERDRPVLNPWLHVRAAFRFANGCRPEPFHPLIASGKFGSRYTLAAACAGNNRVILYSDEMQNVMTADVPFDGSHDGFNEADIEYSPVDRIMTVRWNNQVVIRQPLNYLITAPSQIRCGLDATFAFKHRFPGKIRVEAQEMKASPPS